MAELNDPFDCRPKFIKGSAQSLPDDIREATMGFMGLLSFSKVKNDPVIWSHYADSHKGLALGLRFPIGNLGPHEVIYSNTLPVLKGEDIVKARTEHPGSAIGFALQNGFLTKAPSWNYEQEYRLFVGLNSCEMRGKHYFQEIPAYGPSEVILGALCEITMEDIDRIMRKAKTATNNTRYGGLVKVRQCRMSEDSFKPTCR